MTYIQHLGVRLLSLALDQLMPGFDLEIGKLAQRVLINPRKIVYQTGVFASKITPTKDGKPVTIELIDAKTKEPKETLEVDAALIATGRAPFTQGLGLENHATEHIGEVFKRVKKIQLKRAYKIENWTSHFLWSKTWSNGRILE